MTAAQPYDKDRDLAAVNARRMELAKRAAFLETTIRLVLVELSGIEKVSATGARVARRLRDAVGGG